MVNPRNRPIPLESAGRIPTRFQSNGRRNQAAGASSLFLKAKGGSPIRNLASSRQRCK